MTIRAMQMGPARRGPSRKGPSRRAVLGGAAAFGAAGLLPHRLLAQGAPLTFWTPGGSVLFCEIHTGLAQAWAAGPSGPGAAEVTCGFGQETEYTQQLIGAIAAGAPPDISMLWDSPIALGLQGAFMPLDAMMAGSRIPAETWPAGLLRSCQFGGVTYGLPVTAGVYSMWYNADLFEAKGIPSDRASFPKTWDELRRLSKEFTVWEGDRLAVAGFLPPREAVTIPIWSALNGARIYDGDAQRYTMDAPENVEMFDWFVSWIDEEYRGDVNLVDRSGNFRDAYNDDTTGLGPAFREGRQAGLQTGCWLMGDFWAEPEPAFTNWNMAPHPVGPSGTDTVSGTYPNFFVIPTGSQQPEAAFGYLEELSLNGVVEWFQRIPDVPANAQVQAVPPQVVVENRGEAFARDITDFLQAQAAIAAPMWDSPVEAFGQDQLARAMERIYTKISTPAEALAEAQAASQAELERVLGG